MDRRNFLTAAGMAAALGTTVAGAAEADKNAAAPNQYLELRHYIPMTGEKKKRLDEYLAQAAIPAWQRAGVGPVGVFTVVYGLNSPSLYVLLPHSSLESLVTTPARLAEDAEYNRAAEAFLGAPMSDPAFARMETTLMRAFDAMPQVEVPTQKKDNKERIFELRIYESHSPRAAAKKVEMFNQGGEIDIFRKTGLQPVFFGQTLAGPLMPNLQYMLCFDDMGQRDAAWAAFRKDPDWIELAADKQYADTVSNISDIILRPTGYSQL